MIEKTEIIWEENEIANLDGSLPLKEGDEFYFSVREFYPRDKKIYIENSDLPETFCDEYLESILEKCDKFHIKKFVVKNVYKSLREDYSRGLNDPSKLHEFYTSITVEEV